MRVIHPFHPLSGRQLVCIGERYNRYGTRLLLRVDGERVCPVPRSWTDAVAPDPTNVISGGRALFLFADLKDLADLVSRLVDQSRRAQADRKANYAAHVIINLPPHSPGGGVGEASTCNRKPHGAGNCP